MPAVAQLQLQHGRTDVVNGVCYALPECTEAATTLGAEDGQEQVSDTVMQQHTVRCAMRESPKSGG